MPVSLRAPTPADLPALSALCLRSKGHWGYDATFLAAGRDALTLTPDDLATTALLMAEDGGTAVGLAQIDIRADPAELLKLFVDPPRIGTGLGRRLFASCVKTARRSGAHTLRIESDPNAVPFYRAMGARQTGSAPSESIPGRKLPVLEVSL